jgi:hypothetical protein
VCYRYVLGYLQATKQEKKILCPNEPSAVEAYIDVAFSLHPDSKSHGGMIIFVGGAIAFAASRKQKSQLRASKSADYLSK